MDSKEKCVVAQSMEHAMLLNEAGLLDEESFTRLLKTVNDVGYHNEVLFLTTSDYFNGLDEDKQSELLEKIQNEWWDNYVTMENVLQYVI
jgi:hypothetical protein